LILALFLIYDLAFWLYFFGKRKGQCVDVNKRHDDDNGGGQREKVKRV